MLEIASGVVGAVIGFVSGLLTPWVKWEIEKRKERLSYRRQMVADWRAAIDKEKYDLGDQRSAFLSSAVYTSLRPHMTDEARKKIEAMNTAYVPAGRGDFVRKYMLLDEVARIEQKWGLL